MVEHGLAWLRHAERLEEVASFARERELKRAMRAASVPAPARAPFSVRRWIGSGLMRLGTRIAASAGS